jgi:glycosyltransferase involved in cell wall biosynthesis
MVISVIIPTLNEEVNLPVTLRQLANHPDVELIVVDGGSIDHTCELAQGLRRTSSARCRTAPPDEHGRAPCDG